MPDAALPEDKKRLSRLKGALKMAFSRKAPRWMKVLRCAVFILGFYPTLEFGVMPNLPGRPLATAEVTELRGIFNNSIDYSKERIHTSKPMDVIVNPFEFFTGNVIYGHTRGNVMIINTELETKDFM